MDSCHEMNRPPRSTPRRQRSLRNRRGDLVTHQALDTASSVDLVKALRTDQCEYARIDHKIDPPTTASTYQIIDVQPYDIDSVRSGQRVKNDNLVDPVNEFRLEESFQRIPHNEFTVRSKNSSGERRFTKANSVSSAVKKSPDSVPTALHE